ncbi:bifunctional purine biosynthesis protein purH [Dipodascopsis tothii]|uniref:bifunctional purine biosynthesis protein purH n=1 Tax=Dipodascopsis tothii TaxID=44089 RepID=UPI0034CEE3D0
MRLTNSQSSRIGRAGKRKRDVAGVDVIYPEPTEEDAESPRKRPQTRLEVIDYSVAIDGEMDELTDVEVGIPIVLSRMWDEVPETGARLGRTGVADINTFRVSLPKVITVAQLHALYPHDPTFVDRELRECEAGGRVRRFVVNSGGDLIMLADEYHRKLAQSIEGAGEHAGVLRRFAQLVRERPADTRLSADDLERGGIDRAEASAVLAAGYLVLSGQPDAYYVSVPNIGSFLKLLTRLRTWIVRHLGRSQWKELLEKMLVERWVGGVKARWHDFRGVRLEWALMALKGEGYIEPFGTPAGRAWKLTGKR